jgi:DNA-binding transcriptional LysR family regulator
MTDPIYTANNIFQKLDLSNVKHFFAVVSFGGFSKANRATGISQPALSLGVQRLEKALGAKLIARKGKWIELTPDGLLFLNFCKQLEGGLNQLMGEMGRHALGAQRRLRIGSALSIGLSPFTEVCARQAREDRPIELDLSAQRTQVVLSEVLAGNFDAGLVLDDVLESRLRFTRIRESQVVFVVGKDLNRLFVKVDWRDAVSRIPLITFPRDTPMRALIDRVCIQNRVSCKTIFSINAMESLVSMAIQGSGGAFVLRSLVQADLKRKTLFEKKPPFPLPKLGMSIVTRKDENGEHVSQMLRALINL